MAIKRPLTKTLSDSQLNKRAKSALRLPPVCDLKSPRTLKTVHKTRSATKTTTTMDISVDTRSPYRIGWPRLRALPLQSKFYSPVPEHRHFLQVHAILTNNEAESFRIQFVDRRRAGEPIGKNPTILVLSSAAHPQHSTKLLKATKEIALYLRESGLQEGVEIIDAQASRKFYTWVIPPSMSSLLDAWKEKIAQIPHLLQRKLWRSVDLIQLGARHNQLRPTVLITARDADDEDWDSITLNIKHLLDRDVDVEVHYQNHNIFACVEGSGEISDLSEACEDEQAFEREFKKPRTGMSFEPDDSLITENDVDATLRLGVSLGCEGGNSGSLGGFIKISFIDSNDIELGLTNHHVLRGEEQEAVPVSRFKTDTTELPPVVSPSDLDMQRYLDRLNISIMETNDILRNPSMKYRATTKKHLVEDRQVLREKRTQLRTELARARGFQTSAGTIFATSGIKSGVHPHYSYNQHLWLPQNTKIPQMTALEWDVDWGLFNIHSSRETSMTIPDCQSHQIRVKMYEVLQRASIREGEVYEVMKVGRTSKATRGLLNPATSILNRSWTHVDYLQPDDKVLKTHQNRPTLVHCIVSLDMDQKPFIEGGDSGSFIIRNLADPNMVATVIGLAVAGNKEYNLGYMAPIDLIVEDIESVTGGKVSAPTNIKFVDGLKDIPADAPIRPPQNDAC